MSSLGNSRRRLKSVLAHAGECDLVRQGRHLQSYAISAPLGASGIKRSVVVGAYLVPTGKNSILFFLVVALQYPPLAVGWHPSTLTLTWCVCTNHVHGKRKETLSLYLVLLSFQTGWENG